MLIWHPAPRGLINAAATHRWTKKNPAPDIVVYLWVWSQRDDGFTPSRNDIARTFGWTEHYARKMIRRVKEDSQRWQQLTKPKRLGRRPSNQQHSQQGTEAPWQVSNASNAY